MLNNFWQGLAPARRTSLIAGVFAIVLVFAAAAFWLLRTEYDVLFANLAPQDAASMTGELDRMKLPYRIGSDGASILVDRNTVHATRLKLMGKDLALHGAVGFELFNNADFGMTEFAQKINYQRALQGELTRTIMSLAEIESVRVHLAFPEEGLFKREQTKAKASITVALHHGKVLRAEQVSGIQRLVSASVTGINPADVTIVNQDGVALTRTSGSSEPIADVSTRQELKSEIEQALARKVAQVLEHSFGAGRVMASVDVTLDMSQVRVTTEDVRGQPEKPGEAVTGVITRERETVRGDGAGTSSRDDASTGTSLRETEYQVGRRVEQVITQPGSIQKLQVVAVIQDPLDANQLAQLKALIGASVGALAERGDTVVVHSIGAFAGTPPAAMHTALNDSAETFVDAVPVSATTLRSNASVAPLNALSNTLMGMIAAVVVLVGVGWFVRRRPGSVASAADTSAPKLSAAQRDAALARMREWMHGDVKHAAGAPFGDHS